MDGIVLASESQSTDPVTGLKDCNTVKIHKIELADQKSFLVAGAASTDLCAETVKAMERIGKQQRFTDYQTPGDVAVQAVKEVKENQKRWFCGTKKELQNHFSQNPFSLMIASFYKGKPNVSILESQLQVVNWPRSQPSIALGNSPMIAEYILKNFTPKKMELFDAMLAAIYTVNEVMSMDSTCSKPIQVGTVEYSNNFDPLRARCHARLWSPEWIENIREEFERRGPQMAANISGLMDSVFTDVTRHLSPTGKRISGYAFTPAAQKPDDKTEK
jgi:hypothetical protein